MQIGAVFPQTEFGNDPAALRDYAQTVEGLGYSHLVVYDHVLSADTTDRPDFSGPYHLDHPFHEIFVLLGYVAAVTTTLGLVPAVLILPQRQTALVAKQASTIDVLSGGRLRLGIGVGWNEVEYVGLGKNFSNRGIRSEEQISLLRELWTNQSITFEGQWERVEEAGIVPLPIQRPIPIWIGGYADVTVDRVARVGDGWFPWRPVDDDTKRAIERLRTLATGYGRNPDDIGLEPRLDAGTGTPDDWRTFAEAWVGLGAGHLCVNTMDNGYTSPQQHLDTLQAVATAFELG